MKIRSIYKYIYSELDIKIKIVIIIFFMQFKFENFKNFYLMSYFKLIDYIEIKIEI